MVSFSIVESIAERGNPFSDGEFVKIAWKVLWMLFSRIRSLVKNVSLSHQTVARRVDNLARNIQESLIKRLDDCEFYSLALDESTNISDTAQLALFVRGVTGAICCRRGTVGYLSDEGHNHWKEWFGKSQPSNGEIQSSQE